MRRRGLGAAVAALSCAGLIAAQGAAAAQVEITADPNNTFSPERTDIQPGDSAVFRNQGGFHDVRFDDGSFRFPSNPSSSLWSSPPKVFPAAGVYRFYCSIHGAKGGVGMAGLVNVGNTGPLPDVDAPDLARASLKPRSGRRLRLTFRTDEKGTATVRFTRRVRGRYRAVRTVKRKVKAGRVTIDLARTASGRRLAAGRYRATITNRDAAGNTSRALRAGATLR